MNQEHPVGGKPQSETSNAQAPQTDNNASPSFQSPNPLHPTQLPSAPGWPLHPALVTSGLSLPGFQIARSYGIVRGITVRSTGASSALASIGQTFSSGSGGSVQNMVEVHEHAHGEALFIMLQRAAQLGANAVIGFCYNITDQNTIVTVLAYGTAVWVEPQ